MSGILNEAFTPCPSGARSSRFSQHHDIHSFDILVDDDSALDTTAQLEFTTEVRHPVLAGTRPRRVNRAPNTVQVFEDRIDDARPMEKPRLSNAEPRGPSGRKSSLLAQPAQRFRPKAKTASGAPSRHIKPKNETQSGLQAFDQEAQNDFPFISQPTHTRAEADNCRSDLKKNLRRNTVYIPSDDTTVPSVFMGLFSPLKSSRSNHVVQVEEDTLVNAIEARILKRRARQPRVVSTCRAPLQPSAKIAQEAASRVDIAGKNGGKENIPPGAILELGNGNKFNPAVQPKPKRLSTVALNAARGASKHHSGKANAQTSLGARKKCPSHDTTLHQKQFNLHALNPSLSFEGRVGSEHQNPLRNGSASLNARASVLSERLGHPQLTRASKIERKSTALNKQYPLLSENMAKPALYEDDWLCHQETVITQLINGLFECTDRDSVVAETDVLRLELLGVYHTTQFAHLYQRLKSSLSCGALSIPRDILKCHGRLKHDIGLRRQFFDIWIKSYDFRALVPALETVVGRRMPGSSALRSFQSDRSLKTDINPQRTMARKLEGFLDTFFLQNEDMAYQASRPGSKTEEAPMRGYRRTVLWSIVLVVLLDHARQGVGTGLPRQLFLSSSPYKSSAEVLHALVRLLLPSGGDITKLLNHLGCHVTYKQHELQEYDYMIENIAVDLRDGVRLTRIVEVLFFTSEAHARKVPEDQNEVTLSSGDTLSLLGDEKDLPLSKHLRYPCISRAAKIHNAQIALSALSSVKGGRAIIGDIRAEDVVDGYREKTIALLWGLVSKWGLTGLIDWDDVRKEIGRLRRKAALSLGYDRVKDEAWFTQQPEVHSDNYASLLQQWATILATLRGLTIRNMTSSFADGAVYGSIVDEYEPFITGRWSKPFDAASRQSFSMSLESRLRVLGCSSQFAYLISPETASPHLLDEDFTLATLAFLCSRLLSASKRARSAVLLQRFWRAHLAKRDELRRRVARDLASDCAAVVQTRNQIIWAKDVITRHWRKYQARKQSTIETKCRNFDEIQRQRCKLAGRRR